MITDEERREVARELRERQGSIGQDEDSRELTKWDDLAAIVLIPEQFRACMRFRNQHNRTQAIRSVIAGRLADLIEPGEPSGHECVPGECPINVRHDNDMIDRDALLGLADEMEDLAEAWGGKYPTNRVAAYARRIREALGATEDE